MDNKCDICKATLPKVWNSFLCHVCKQSAQVQVKNFCDGPESPPNVLESASKLVAGDRNRDYGSIEKNFKSVATMWEIILGAQVRPDQVALCMVALKLCRQSNKHKRDNLVDMASYAGIAGQILGEGDVE